MKKLVLVAVMALGLNTAFAASQQFPTVNCKNEAYNLKVLGVKGCQLKVGLYDVVMKNLTNIVKIGVNAHMGKPYKTKIATMEKNLSNGFSKAFYDSAANLKKGQPEAKAIYEKCIVKTRLFEGKAKKAMADIVKDIKGKKIDPIDFNKFKTMKKSPEINKK